MRGLGAAVLASLTLAWAPAAVRAQASLIDDLGGPLGFGDACLGPNDDGSSAPIDLEVAFPGGLSFFGARYTELFVNTNGNVTFDGPLATYLSSAFPVAAQPMIAPYWADADIRTDDVCAEIAPPTPESCHAPADNGVWWAVQADRVVVTWHRVGYYDCHRDLRMSFQLVLQTPALCALEDDFDVEFRYAECGWATGDKGGGVGGFGGEEAQAGFDAGNELDWVEIPGSRESGIHTQLCTESNVGAPGIWRFRVRAGGVVCPDAGDACDTGESGVCSQGATACVAGTTSCTPLASASAESCNGLDDDCDDAVDEADGAGSLCPAGRRCVRGRCAVPCSEFGCPSGLFCDEEEGGCLDEDCRDVECEAGQRCVLGVCAGQCDGITCPVGLTCRAGRCIDPCAGVDCGACGVCDAGRCVDRCEVTGCATGTTCAEGACVDSACVDVDCGLAERCVEGGCVDPCDGARCPRGERCQLGVCLPVPPDAPDAGPPPARDSGPPPSVDASSPPMRIDAGVTPEPSDEGCGCRAVGARRSATVALLAPLALVLRRRRPRGISRGRTPGSG